MTSKDLLLWTIVGGLGIIVLKKKKKFAKVKTLVPRLSHGLEVQPNCDIVVRDDGPGIELINETAALIYAGSPVPPGGAQLVLATALRTAHPRCTWPPTRSDWRFSEGDRSASWIELVAAWELKFAEARGEMP